jgi:hypothetical protein
MFSWGIVWCGSYVCESFIIVEFPETHKHSGNEKFKF